MTSHAGKDFRNNNTGIKIPTFTTCLALQGVSIPDKINNLEILRFE
jgi:hypothetical protein